MALIKKGKTIDVTKPKASIGGVLWLAVGVFIILVAVALGKMLLTGAVKLKNRALPSSAGSMDFEAMLNI